MASKRKTPAPMPADEPGPSTLEGPRTQTLGGASDEDARVQQIWLQVTAGPDAGATHSSKRARTIIGTHETADFVLTDPTVSRFHCDLTPQAGGRVELRDLDSRNGSVIDGVSVLAGHLRSGATIKLGHSELRFQLGPDSVAVPISARERFGVMVGRSPAIRRAFALLERAAESDATVLLEGETGTGKEAAAESVHLESARKEEAFVVVDCGAIPPDLLESELFGHERGAFTGAVSPREGAFEAAAGGTIFLDEIGELSTDLQPKLLRVLEKREIKRVGSSRYFPVDVRVIAATNRNLRAEVNARRFRSDLYYRLAVLEVRLPPLRERAGDLPALVDHILAGLGAKAAEAQGLRGEDFVAELARHGWPGNVRELRNYLERCLALRAPMPITPEPAPSAFELPPIDLSQPLKETREAWVRPLEKRYLEAMRARHGSIAAAARATGVDRVTFYRLLWRHGLK